MENTKDDSPMKARFFVLRKEIYKKRAVCAHANLVLRKVIMLISKQQKVAWDSQTRISEPDRRTNEQGVDDSDDDDIDSDASTTRQDQH